MFLLHVLVDLFLVIPKNIFQKFTLTYPVWHVHSSDQKHSLRLKVFQDFFSCTLNSVIINGWYSKKKQRGQFNLKQIFHCKKHWNVTSFGHLTTSFQLSVHFFIRRLYLGVRWPVQKQDQACNGHFQVSRVSVRILDNIAPAVEVILSRLIPMTARFLQLGSGNVNQNAMGLLPETHKQVSNKKWV